MAEEELEGVSEEAGEGQGRAYAFNAGCNMKNSICQSCGMPMSEKDFGIGTDGTKNKEYCHFCFKNGTLTDEGITVEERIKKNIEIAKKMGMSEQKAKASAETVIPKLKRWKK